MTPRIFTYIGLDRNKTYSFLEKVSYIDVCSIEMGRAMFLGYINTVWNFVIDQVRQKG